MELFIALGAFVLIDVLAIRFGPDTRPVTTEREPARDFGLVRSRN